MASPSSSPYYEIILLGEPGVGKTCLFTRISEDIYVEDKERVTVGLDYVEKTVSVNGEDIQVSNSLSCCPSHLTLSIG